MNSGPCLKISGELKSTQCETRKYVQSAAVSRLAPAPSPPPKMLYLATAALLATAVTAQGGHTCERDLYDLCREVEHSPKLCYDCLHE